MNPGLSVFVITLNEEANLPRCLASVQELADEIVVVDSGSSDETKKIAHEAGARVLKQSWLGFVGQKNFALEQCTLEWALSLDADEELSPELLATLQSLKNTLGASSDHPNAYAMPRRVLYEGKWIYHGDWYPDFVTRLFRRSQCHFVGGTLHESLQVSGKIDRLSGDILHYTYKDSQDHKQRIVRYSKLWAEGKKQEGKKVGPLSPYVRAIFRFVRAYLLRGGFLDGRQGLIIAWYCSGEVFLKYQNLRALYP